MVAHNCDRNTQRAEGEGLSWMPIWATQQNPMSKKKKLKKIFLNGNNQVIIITNGMDLTNLSYMSKISHRY